MSVFENGFSEVSLTLNLVVSINGHLQNAYVKRHVSENPESNFFTNEFGCPTQCAWFVNVYGICGHENQRE
jgi:hypothetical protein